MSDEQPEQLGLIDADSVVQARTFVHKDQLAHLLGVTPRTITAWQEQASNPLPALTSGQSGRANRYDLKVAIAWHVEHIVRQRVQLAPSGDALDLDYERARLARVQADIAELTLAERRGEVMTHAEFERIVGAMIVNARARLLALPTRTAHQLVSMRSPAAIAAVLTNEVHQALAELADSDPGTAHE